MFQFKTKLFTLLLCSLCISSCSLDEETEGLIALKNVNLIDAENGLRVNQDIIIQGEYILKLGNVGDIKIPKNARIIDGEGKYLIPGLWDAHVHLSFIKELSPAMFRLFLANGVTSIRDTGGQLDLVMPWKKKSDEMKGNAPRVMVAGPLLDGVPTVYDGSSSSRPKLGVGASSPEEAVQIVDQLQKAGVDQIKSYEMLSPESFRAVLDRAKSHGLKVTGHVPLSMDVVQASDAGLNSMEHMRNLEMACSSEYLSLLDERKKLLAKGINLQGGILRTQIHSAQRTRAIETQDEVRRDVVLSKLAENDTWQIPTLTIVMAGFNRLYLDEVWRDNFQYLPEPVKTQWNDRAVELENMELNSNAETFATWALEMISHLDEANVPIMAGTDTPIAFLTPGFSLHKELELLVQGGLSPLKAIEAATLRPAQYFNMEDKIGTISVGKNADLVLLDANPLEDIKNTMAINSVIRQGILHNRSMLDQILNGSEMNE